MNRHALIISRQLRLGGIDLSGQDIKGNAWFDDLSRVRNAIIKSFYDFCKTGDVKESWSAWKKRTTK
jgi:hypothetical protein